MSSSDKHHREVSTADEVISSSELVSATPEILAGDGPEDCILETLACNTSAQCFSSLQFKEVLKDVDLGDTAIEYNKLSNYEAVQGNDPDGCILVGDTEPEPG